MNKVILVGRLGKDPETTNGVVKFSLATDESFKDKDGNKVEKTSWHNCVAFGKTGEVIAKYVTKGQMFCVEGKIEYSKYEDKFYTNIVVNGFTFVSSKNDRTEDASAPYATIPQAEVVGDKDDLPF